MTEANNSIEHSADFPVCIFCSIPLNTILNNVQDPSSKEIFSILQCKKCKLEVTYPQPPNIRDYYPRQYHGNRHGFTAQVCARRRLKWVNQFHKINKGRLLDIGCGDGTFLHTAERDGWCVYGTEINSTIASSKKIEVRESLDDMQSLAPFDCITLWHSLEHMAEPKKIISCINTMLAPNGTVFIAVPNAHGLQSRLFGKKWLHRDVPRHLYHFGPAPLLKLLGENGFKPLKIWHQEFEYDVMGWSQSTLNYFFTKQNIFFNLLTDRSTNVSPLIKILNWICGTSLSLLALPLVLLTSMLSMGGTLVVATKKI